MSNLPGRSENPSKKMHQTSAVLGFQDNEILEGSTLVIKEVKNALKKHNLLLELEQLKYLEKMLSLKKTGSDYLINNYNLTGKVLKPGGLSTKDKFILF